MIEPSIQHRANVHVIARIRGCVRARVDEAMTALSNTFDRLPTHRGRDSGGQLLPLVLKTVCVIGGLSAAHLAGFMLRVPDPFRMLAITSLAADVTTIFWFHVVAFYVASAAVATTVYAVLLNLLHHVALPRRRRFRFGPSGAVNGPDRPEDGIPTTTRPESVGDPVAERGDGAPAKPVRPRRALDDLRERVQPVSNYRRTEGLAPRAARQRFHERRLHPPVRRLPASRALREGLRPDPHGRSVPLPARTPSRHRDPSACGSPCSSRRNTATSCPRCSVAARRPPSPERSRARRTGCRSGS